MADYLTTPAETVENPDRPLRRPFFREMDDVLAVAERVTEDDTVRCYFHMKEIQHDGPPWQRPTGCVFVLEIDGFGNKQGYSRAIDRLGRAAATRRDVRVGSPYGGGHLYVGTVDMLTVNPNGTAVMHLRGTVYGPKDEQYSR